MEKMEAEKIPARERIKMMEQEDQDRRDKIKAEMRAEQERIDAQTALREELKEKGEKLGVALAMPNHELPGLDVRGRFCQQREFMIQPWDMDKRNQHSELKGKTRPFVSWESHGIQWHEDEEAVRAEMAEKFPDDPLYSKELKGEDMGSGRYGFNKGRARIVQIIQNWEKMKDEEEGDVEDKKAMAA